MFDEETEDELNIYRERFMYCRDEVELQVLGIWISRKHLRIGRTGQSTTTSVHGKYFDNSSDFEEGFCKTYEKYPTRELYTLFMRIQMIKNYQQKE